MAPSKSSLSSPLTIIANRLVKQILPFATSPIFSVNTNLGLAYPHPLPLSRDHKYVVPGARGVAERIVFLPPRPFDDYCRLLQLADVILDTRHFGAGITCYDMFSYNLPVVTWPGELILGRFTQACYHKMGVEDLVVHSAEEYVSKAVQVATDGDYRQFVTQRIAQASDVLFNDLEAVREHERFFDEALWDRGVSP